MKINHYAVCIIIQLARDMIDCKFDENVSDLGEPCSVQLQLRT